jgi:hypothetical protein
MKRIFFAVLSFFSVIGLNAQDEKNFLNLKGRVVDATDNQPVAYTNIGVEGTFYGTASNANGDFELKIPGDLSGRKIYFSAVGFRNQLLPLTGLAGREKILIRLDPQTYDIGEVDINASSQVIMRILRTASENIPANYLPGPIRITGNYENIRIVDDSITLSLKADVIINDLTGYRNPGKISAYRGRGYSLESVSRNFRSYSFPDGATNLDELLDLDWVRARSSLLSPGLLQSFDLSKEDDKVTDGKVMYVISFRQRVPTLEGSGEFYGSRFEGKIYIEVGSYYVNKIEGRTAAPQQNRQGRGLAIGSGNSAFYNNVSCEFSISYKDGIPEKIVLNKQYRYQNKGISERTLLTVTGKQQPGQPVAISRDYFVGE